MDRIRARIPRVPLPSESTRLLLPPVIGIVIGVLLIATGTALVQVAGVAAIGCGLLVARGWLRVPDAWWSDPRGEIAASGERLRQRLPGWAWTMCVGVFIAVAGIVLVSAVVSGGDLDAGTLSDLVKGAIALVMVATLALWGTFRLPDRLVRIRKGVVPTAEPEQSD